MDENKDPYSHSLEGRREEMREMSNVKDRETDEDRECVFALHELKDHP